MATIHSILTNFTAGELSPRLYGRVDLAKYQNGARTLENFIVLPQGGVRKRGGTQLIHPVKDANAYSRLVRFEFSTLQSYMLEIGPGYVRFYKDRGIIVDVVKNIEGVTRGPTTTVTSTAHGFAAGDRVVIGGALGMVELNNREFEVANALANSFELLGLDSSTYGAWTSGGTASRVYEIATLYEADDIADLTFTQSADTLYVFHPDWPIQLLTRSSHIDWTLTTANVVEGPFGDMNEDDDNTVSIDVASGTGVMTFSKDTLEQAHVGALFRVWEYANGSTFGYAMWAPGSDVNVANGSFWEYQQNVYYVVSGGGETMASTASYPTHTRGTAQVFYGNNGGEAQMRYEHSGFCIVQVTEVVDTKNAWVSVVKNRTPYSAYGARSSMQWEEGAWSDKNGYPTCGAFHEQRLVAAATAAQPSTFWGSVTGSYLKYADGDKDDRSYKYTISSDQVDAIKYLESTKRLNLFCSGAEYIVAASSTNQAITPTNIKVSRETSFGTANVNPVRAGPAILFMARAGMNSNPARRLREFVYNFQTDSWVAPDLSILSDHITYPGLLAGAFMAAPDVMIWYARQDGGLVGLTYERDQQVVGWHRHALGGGGKVRNVASIPGVEGDELWLLVERTVGGQTVRYIEMMMTGYKDGDTVEDSYFLDSSLTYEGAPATNISGLWSLNGQTVAALADGVPVRDLTVTNGAITLNTAASKVLVGHSYKSTLQTLHIEAGAQGGTAQGAIGRVFDVLARLHNSIGGMFGPNDAKQDPIKYRPPDQPLSEAIQPFSGDKVLQFEGEWDRDRYLTITHDEPLPFTVVAIVVGQRVNQ